MGGAGILLALAVFMADSIRALPAGLDTVRQVLPTAFNWPVFGAALLLMATPLAHTGRRWLSTRREASGSRRSRYRTLTIYFFRAALMSASMWSRYFSNARRPAALSRYCVRGMRPANVFSHSR